MARNDLIDRSADVEIGALRLLRVRLREKDRARSEVVAADLRRLERLGHAHVGVADDGEVLAPRLERGQRAFLDQLEVASDLGRRPEVLGRAPVVAAGGAVHRLDEDDARLVGHARGRSHAA
jgi:hypothetical protein